MVVKVERQGSIKEGRIQVDQKEDLQGSMFKKGSGRPKVLQGSRGFQGSSQKSKVDIK